MTDIAPKARLKPEDSGDLVPAVGVPVKIDIEKIDIGMPDGHQDASVAKKEVLRSARECFLPRRLHSAPMSRKPRHASREKEKCGSSDVPSRQPENSSSLSSSPRMSP